MTHGDEVGVAPVVTTSVGMGDAGEQVSLVALIVSEGNGRG